MYDWRGSGVEVEQSSCNILQDRAFAGEREVRFVQEDIEAGV